MGEKERKIKNHFSKSEKQQPGKERKRGKKVSIPSGGPKGIRDQQREGRKSSWESRRKGTEKKEDKRGKKSKKGRKRAIKVGEKRSLLRRSLATNGQPQKKKQKPR